MGDKIFLPFLARQKRTPATGVNARAAAPLALKSSRESSDILRKLGTGTNRLAPKDRASSISIHVQGMTAFAASSLRDSCHEFRVFFDCACAHCGSIFRFADLLKWADVPCSRPSRYASPPVLAYPLPPERWCRSILCSSFRYFLPMSRRISYRPDSVMAVSACNRVWCHIRHRLSNSIIAGVGICNRISRRERASYSLDDPARFSTSKKKTVPYSPPSLLSLFHSSARIHPDNPEIGPAIPGCLAARDNPHAIPNHGRRA